MYKSVYHSNFKTSHFCKCWTCHSYYGISVNLTNCNGSLWHTMSQQNIQSISYPCKINKSLIFTQNQKYAT